MSDLQGDDIVKVLVVMSEQTDIQTMDWNLHNAKSTFATRHRTVIETLQEGADHGVGIAGREQVVELPASSRRPAEATGSMAEVAHAGEYHCDAVFVRRIDDLIVTH